MTYRDAFRRDLAILRGPPGWRKTLLIFGMVLPIVGLCANVDMVTVEHAAAWLTLSWLTGNAVGASLAVALRRPRGH